MLDFFKLKEFADDNFKFDENGRKFSKGEENTVGKGEIARHEQFLLSPPPPPSVFMRLVLQTRKNQGLFGKGLNTILNNCIGEKNLVRSVVMVLALRPSISRFEYFPIPVFLLCIFSAILLDFVRKMRPCPGLAFEPLIPFGVQKRTGCQNKDSSHQ